MCFRRVLPKSIPQPTNKVRKTFAETAIAPNSELSGHRATVLRQISREDTHRNVDKRYAAIRKFIFVALHGDHVTHNVATASGRLIHALRLTAVSAKSTLRSFPTIHQGCSAVRRRRHFFYGVPKRRRFPSQPYRDRLLLQNSGR